MSWDEPRCVWCRKIGGTTEPLHICIPNALGTNEQDIEVLVHVEHKDETRRYFAYSRRYARIFLTSVLLGVVALLGFAALSWKAGAAAAVIYYGVIFIMFPFSTPTTLELIGVKNSIRFAQLTGAAFVIGGSVMLYALI